MSILRLKSKDRLRVLDGAVRSISTVVAGVEPQSENSFGGRPINTVCHEFVLLTKWTAWVPIFTAALK